MTIRTCEACYLAAVFFFACTSAGLSIGAFAFLVGLEQWHRALILGVFSFVVSIGLIKFGDWLDARE